MKITAGVVTTLFLVLFTSGPLLAGDKTPDSAPPSNSVPPSTCKQDETNHTCMKDGMPPMTEGHQGTMENHTNTMNHGCQPKNGPIDNNGHHQHGQDSISK